MDELDIAIKNFKRMFNLKGNMQIAKLMEEVYKGRIMILQLLTCNNGELYAGQIATKLCISTARVAAAINSLEAKGYVCRCHSNDDGRKVLVQITASGEQIRKEYENKIDNILKETFKKLSNDELQTFISLGYKMFS